MKEENRENLKVKATWLLRKKKERRTEEKNRKIKRSLAESRQPYNFNSCFRNSISVLDSVIIIIISHPIVLKHLSTKSDGVFSSNSCQKQMCFTVQTNAVILQIRVNRVTGCSGYFKLVLPEASVKSSANLFQVLTSTG